MKVKYYTHDDRGILQEVEEEWDFSEFEKERSSEMKVKHVTHNEQGFLDVQEVIINVDEFEKEMEIKEKTNDLEQEWDEIKRIFETGLSFKEDKSIGGLFYYFNLRIDNYKKVLDFFEKQKEYGFIGLLETLKKVWDEFYQKEMNEIIKEVEKILEKHSKFLNTNSILENLENSLKEEFFYNFDKLSAKGFLLIWRRINEKYNAD